MLSVIGAALCKLGETDAVRKVTNGKSRGDGRDIFEENDERMQRGEERNKTAGVTSRNSRGSSEKKAWEVDKIEINPKPN